MWSFFTCHLSPFNTPLELTQNKAAISSHRLVWSSLVNSQSSKEEYKKAFGNAPVPDVLDDLLRNWAALQAEGLNAASFFRLV